MSCVFQISILGDCNHGDTSAGSPGLPGRCRVIPVLPGALRGPQDHHDPPAEVCNGGGPHRHRNDPT